MSVLIKGMEMPESCRSCPMEMYYMIYGETRCGVTNRILASDFKTIAFEGRADDCPLIEFETDTNVGDSVNRQAAIKALDGEITVTGIENTKAVQEYIRSVNLKIRELPSAEPEIVRCKDCREFRRFVDTDITFCDRTEVEVKDDDFCSHAKKMEVEHERPYQPSGGDYCAT